MKRDKKTIMLSLVLCSVFVLASLGLQAAKFLSADDDQYKAFSLLTNLRTRDELFSCHTIIRSIPTGNQYITKLFEKDTLEFRVVELKVEETIKGQEQDTVWVLQTTGMRENPIMKKGNEYLLFLELYEGDIKNTDGVYVDASAHWSYYAIGKDGAVAPMVDEEKEVIAWMNEKQTKNDGTQSFLDYVRAMAKSK